MDTCSSGEDLTIKARKPYIITKQRERWTEEEHNRFLEAIKLYGRAWQRIEEHIGTKTAVQIRSHAQKFFTKLEKEAVLKGIPAGQALDIEIPPPRPKRKPSNPFPRKTAAVGPLSAAAETADGKLPPSVTPDSQILNIEKEPLPEKPHGNSSSGTVNIGEETYNSSMTMASENCIPTPLVRKELVYQNNNSCFSFEAEAEAKEKEKAVPVGLNLNHMIPDSTNSYPHHSNISSSHVNEELNHNRDTNPATCTTTDHPPPFPSFHPFFSPPVCHNQQDYDFRSFFNMPTFWNQIISALLQNPAAHRAATLSATLWPLDQNLETCHPDHPSMQAIVATTVAAATAWWAAHGLIPSCTPYINSSAKPAATAAAANHDKAGSIEIDDPNKLKDRKPVDHSSCGSNASGSEIEIEVLPKEDDNNANHLIGDSLNRRCKNSSIITDSWKEVSEEGRVAFRALFSREVLPQSFKYPPIDNVEYALRLGLNTQYAVVQESMNNNNNNNNNIVKQMNDGDQESMLDLELGLSKLNNNNNKAGRRTGFKPYKRCCSTVLEAKDTMTTINSNGGEKNPKRICLEQQVLS
ncbi:protein LATE ELONGATED HYPOCOTYL-like isoform X2 [Impatiens glandulifera]|uniref:protein LATE ELONGATED HYPOCOTYL-like isoform X2 n=1 Tax=Impatiens glandulifera TaxID=253017 RepID=UPI001FB101A9|nr:protein LATE ELONGATED HYPOCOTYL-like isoform X2 [Impatiens glandulifera]